MNLPGLGSIKRLHLLRLGLGLIALTISVYVGYAASGRMIMLLPADPTLKIMDVSEITANVLYGMEKRSENELGLPMEVTVKPLNEWSGEVLDWSDHSSTARVCFYYRSDETGIKHIERLTSNQGFAFLATNGVNPVFLVKDATPRSEDGQIVLPTDMETPIPLKRNSQPATLSDDLGNVWLFDPDLAQLKMEELAEFMFDLATQALPHDKSDPKPGFVKIPDVGYSQEDLGSMRSYAAAALVVHQAAHLDPTCNIVVNAKTLWSDAYNDQIIVNHHDYLASIWPNMVEHYDLVILIIVMIFLTWIVIKLGAWNAVVVADYKNRQREQRAEHLEQWLQGEVRELWSRLDQQYLGDVSLQRAHTRATDSTESELTRRTAIGEIQAAYNRQVRLAARCTPIPSCVGVAEDEPNGPSKREEILTRLSGLVAPESFIDMAKEWSLTRIKNLERLVYYADDQFGPWSLSLIYSYGRLSGMLDNSAPLINAVRDDDSELVATLLKLSDQDEDKLLAGDGEKILSAMSGRRLAFVGSPCSVPHFTRIRQVVQDLGAKDARFIGPRNKTEIKEMATYQSIFILVRAGGSQELAQELREYGADVIIINRFNLEQLCQSMESALAA